MGIVYENVYKSVDSEAKRYQVGFKVEQAQAVGVNITSSIPPAYETNTGAEIGRASCRERV